MMTKQDFIALADMIIHTNKYCPGEFTPSVLTRLADFCCDQNPRFNRERWLDYIAGKAEGRV